MTARLSILVLIIIIFLGCDKEYSFEGGAMPPPRDTISVPPPPAVPVCQACSSIQGSTLPEWKFKSGNWTICGKADTAIALGNRTTFTFFGPSACSVDTGMVITVYLNGDTLNRDRQNLQARTAAFYCYDRVTPSYIFMSQGSNSFSVTIDRYTHSTGIATGTFRGAVSRANGASASIDSGRFTVKLL
ncbi:MAG: hypothetical protein JNM19_17245 [Chitinophagaceae bacterium]|nr:hypothetical protein [Chitinophagaceae bacterium]